MDFSKALVHLKEGKHLRRRGWNGKGMCIFLTEGSVVEMKDLKPRSETAISLHAVDSGFDYTEEAVVRIRDHIDMVAADGTLVIGWLASQTDMLAEDWEIVE